MKKFTFLFLFTFTFSLFPLLCEAQYAVLYDFDFGGPKGSSPHGELTPNTTGNLFYGMTQIGGTIVNANGTIFSIDTNGNNYRVLYDFNYNAGVIGSLLLSGHTMYGMTSQGGGGVGVYCPTGCGCVFSIDTNGTQYKQLLTFDGNNGGFVFGNVILIGTRLFGLSISGGVNNAGCAFAIDSGGGGYKDILDFNHTNGAAPEGSFISFGKVLYGMATVGGAHDSGCIFKLDTNGGGYKDLHDFHGIAGAEPCGTLLYAAGKFYGLTVLGGTHDSGVVFSIDTNGSNYKKLYDFSRAEGAYPRGTLSISGKTLYGMTSLGGASDSGVVFTIDTDGTNYTKLVDFGGDKGSYPWGSPTLLGNTIYGMTTSGGNLYDGGVIFSFRNTTTTGTGELNTKNENISVYPNPNNGQVTIKSSVVSGQASVQIYNMLGEKVHSSNYSLSTNHYSLDLSNQPNGIYLYRVLNEDGSLLGEGKVIIQK